MTITPVMGKMSTTKAKHSQAPHPAIVSLPQFVQLYREWRKIENTGNFLNTYEGLKVIKKSIVLIILYSM
jgi:hypothetical protein